MGTTTSLENIVDKIGYVRATAGGAAVGDDAQAQQLAGDPK